MRALPVTVLAVCGLVASACGSGGSDNAMVGRAAAQADQVAPAPSGRLSDQSAKDDEQKAAPPLDGKVIVIDPGHNGGNYRAPAAINRKVNVLTQWKACDTTGTATNNGYSEASFTLDVSRRLAKILEGRGAKVKLTRTDNDSVGPCITERAAIGNKAKADAAISIHADGAPASAHGFHVIMPKKIKGPVDRVVGKSAELGEAVRDAYREGTKLPYSTYIGHNALNYRNDLGGLNLSTVPKIFIETGNMRNASEAAKFQDPKFRQKIALALANGLQHYLKA